MKMNAEIGKVSMKQRACFMKQPIKFTNLQPNRQKNRKTTEITNIRNETMDITTDPVDIKRIKKEYYAQPYTYKLGNLDKLDQFLKKHTLTTHPG